MPHTGSCIVIPSFVYLWHSAMLSLVIDTSRVLTYRLASSYSRLLPGPSAEQRGLDSVRLRETAPPRVSPTLWSPQADGDGDAGRRHVQSRQPCSAQVPHMCMSAVRRAWRARCRRTEALLGVMPSAAAASRSEASSSSTRWRMSRYSGFRACAISSTHWQTVWKSASSGTVIPVLPG